MKKAISLLVVLLLSTALYADTITFKNGDIIKGKLISMEGGDIVFNSTVAGKITVSQVKIKKLELDKEVTFVMADGSQTKSTGTISDSSLNIKGKPEIKISKLAAINPTPPELPKFSGNITAGLTSSHGNTYAQNGSVSVELIYETDKDTTATNVSYAATRSEDADGEKYTTEEYFTAGLKREYNISIKTYGFADANYKTDHIADLDRRIIGTLGFGHRFYKTKAFSLNADLGLSELHERYIVDGDADTNDELSVRMGCNLKWLVNDKLTFKHSVEYYPSTDEYSNYFLTAKAEFRYRFNDKVYGSFKTLFDYDASPAETNTSTDTKYILGLGVDF